MHRSNKKKKKKILFLAEKSILDRNSGAALEVSTWFEYLREAGHKCYSMSMSCFDGQEEYPVSDLVSKDISLCRDVGRVAELTLNGVNHRLLLTRSTNTLNLTQEDVISFHRVSKEFMQNLKPDVIVSFGSKLMEPLIQCGNDLGARTLFYLANTSYTEENLPTLKAAREIISPSETLKSYYKETLGLKKIKVIPVSPNHSVERSLDDLPDLAKSRHDRFVTMINPTIEKGGLIFINIANQYRTVDPSLTFLAVESRGKRSDWVKAGISAAAITNLWWIPSQADIGSVFRKTSILLVPSIVPEGAGKVISEALVCGIPVIGSDSGAIPTQLNGSGDIIPLKEDVRRNPNVVPSQHIQVWVEAITRLLQDDMTYLAASQKALQAGQIYRRSAVARKVIAHFEST